MTKAKLYSEIQSGLIHVASEDLSVEKCWEGIESMIDQYVLQIAEKAVAEVLKEYKTVGLVSPAIIADGILKRIKTEIGDTE